MELDHIFICVSRGAPEAEALREFGLVEGTPNRHAGQGSACRRFFFENAMLELLWIEDELEAREGPGRDLRLWERCFSGAGSLARKPGPRPALCSSPFGIIVRGDEPCPFDAWDYRPETMPGLKLKIARTPLDEPMWCYGAWARNGPPGTRLTAAQVTLPNLPGDSVTAAMSRLGLIHAQPGDAHLVEIELDGGRRGERRDFRPLLPLTIRR